MKELFIGIVSMGDYKDNVNNIVHLFYDTRNAIIGIMAEHGQRMFPEGFIKKVDAVPFFTSDFLEVFEKLLPDMTEAEVNFILEVLKQNNKIPAEK